METDSALKLFFGSFEQNEKNRDRKRLLELMRTSQSDSKKQHAHYYSLILAFFFGLLLFAKTWRFDVCNRIQCIFNRFIIYFHSPESVKLVKLLCLLTKIHFSHHQKFLFDENLLHLSFRLSSFMAWRKITVFPKLNIVILNSHGNLGSCLCFNPW